MGEVFMVRGPGFWFTFIYYTVTATTVAAIASAPLLFEGNLGLEALQTALPAGLAIGALGAYFNHSIAIDFAMKNTREFQQQLTQTLADLGFSPMTDPDPALAEFAVYERGAIGKWFSGRVLVKLDRQQATIMGRAGLMRKLRDRLSQA
ncbi:MAG: hypothetical protein EA001_04750 [Oscillatoriales cyanobacterium]|nr:MAG: hypothetical protein EA001_04750 [Oscillatoriales cyanobacterium]